MGNQREDLPSQKTQPSIDTPDIKKKDIQPDKKPGAADEDRDMESAAVRDRSDKKSL